MKVQDLLFQYLKDVIYDPKCAQLNVEELPQDFQTLGEGMKLVGEWIKEARSVSSAIAKGDLTYQPTDPENVFVAPLKELQSVLRHLAWQTQQVAKGDYSQKITFMGEFADAFNTMTKQLQERRSALVEEKQNVENQNRNLNSAVQLVMLFANYTKNMVIIHSLDDNRDLFVNNTALVFFEEHPHFKNLLQEKLKEKEKITEKEFWEFETRTIEDEIDMFFMIESYPVSLDNRPIVAHILTDDLKRKKQEAAMSQLAYQDSLTGCFNRRFAFKKMNDLMTQGFDFVLSFVDVDYLKYCNDTFGHHFGDAYILDVVDVLKPLGTCCRVGGDEFLLIQVNTTAKQQNQLLEECRRKIKATGEFKSFSYASGEIKADSKQSLEEMIEEIDQLMYEYKTIHRKVLDDYIDDRMTR